MKMLRRWWVRCVLAGGAGLALLVAFGPTLVARSPLLTSLGCSAAGVRMRVSVGDASLGWFRPITLENIVAEDREGQPLLTVKQLTSTRTLAGLLADPTDLGKFRCEGLVLSLRCLDQQTNLESALVDFLEPSAGASRARRPAVELELVNAAVHIDDAITRQHWHLDNLNATFLLPAEAAPAQLVVTGKLGDRPLTVNATADLGAAARGTLLAQADAVPLALLDPVLRRIVPGARLTGSVAARVDARWDAAAVEKLTLAGNITATQVALTRGQDRVTVAEARLEAGGKKANDLRISARDVVGMSVREPQVELTCSVSADPANATVRLTTTRLHCSTATVVIPELVATPGAGLAVRGTLQGDVARLQRWAMLTEPPLQGTIQGEFAVEPTTAGLRWSVDLQGQRVVVGLPAAPLWSEPSPKLTGRGRLDFVGNEVTVDELKVKADAVALAAKGRVANPIGTGDLAFTGELEYDMARLTPALRNLVGTDLQVAGKGTRPVTLTGTLAAPVARAGVNWDSAQALGCTLGSGEALAEYRDDWVRTQPIRTTLNQGALVLQPSVRCSNGLELQLPAGRLLEGAQITPAMCAGLLGKALPALADVTQVAGQVTVDVEQCRVPPGNLAAGTASGRLTVQGVRLGASPLLAELGGVLRSAAGCQIRDGVIPVTLKDGRIYHRDLELVFPDATVRTQGWVGLDGTLSLVAEMPMPAKWVGGDRVGSALSDQIIRLPITGTVARPHIDSEELRKANTRAVRDTVRNGVRNEVEKNFRKLLGGQ